MFNLNFSYDFNFSRLSLFEFAGILIPICGKNNFTNFLDCDFKFRYKSCNIILKG